ALLVVDHPDQARRLIGPAPEHHVAIIVGGARGEARDDDRGGPDGGEAAGEGPTWRSFALIEQLFPRARQLRWRDAERALGDGIGQIGDIVAIDLVGAYRQRLGLEGEALLRLAPGGLHAARRVEGGHADGIEAAAVAGRAVAGDGIERPAGIVRAMDGPGEPHAYPPTASRSR